MLPIGLIVALGLFFVLTASGVSFFPGEFFLIMVVVLVGVAAARLLFRRSRRTKV